MKYGVSPNTLLITAGTIWSLAGVNILRIGLTCWIDDGHYWLFKVCEASLVFLLFFGIIFHRLYKKHTLRISQKKGKHCPFSFFDVKGWIVMIGMITMGINYLGFLKSFSTFCLSHNYITKNPTEGISSLGRRGKKKIRCVIEEDKLQKIHGYLLEKNPYMLLASYILYYCFIRPAEMTRLKLKNISLARQTIFVEDTISKNRKDGTITLPTKVIHLMLDLKIFDYPGDYYLFSDGLKPGKRERTEKMFRDWWARHVRKDLKLSAKYKFYSLKDTGITNMLRHYDVLSVRDQARHSSILMTDIYTPHDIQEANSLIKNYDGIF